ncbi:hypothetical protein PG995_006844 [Apiospora arundinis]
MATMNATIAGTMPSNNHETDEVHIALRLNMKERLMSLTYTSSINLIASRNHQFTADHFKSLRRFNGFIRNDYTNLFPRIARPILDLFLVWLRPLAGTGSPSKSEVRICVSGLKSPQEIVHFHQVLTQPHLRVHSDPLKLCFNRALIDLTGAYALHNVDVAPETITLCGGLLRSFAAGDSTPKQKSTIGGMVEVDGVAYAVTIIHNRKQHGRESEEEVAHMSSADLSPEETLLETTQQVYLEPPLAIDIWEEDGSKPSEWGHTNTRFVASNTDKKSTMATQWSPTNEEIISLDGWALIPVPPECKRPNLRMMPEFPDFMPGTDYIIGAKYDEFPSVMPVSILSGVSEQEWGMLSPHISFLVQEDGTSHEVWRVDLQSHDAMKQGDSGSWVINTLDNSCIGSVTATSRGVAYIIPLADLLEKVRMRFGQSSTVSMPLPFATFCNVLQDESLRARYLDQAISERCLRASAQDRVAEELLHAIRAGRADLVKELMEEVEFDYLAMERVFADALGSPKDDIVKANVLAKEITSCRIPQARPRHQVLGGKVDISTPVETITAPSLGQRIRGKVSRMLSSEPNSKKRSSRMLAFGRSKDDQEENMTGKQQSQESGGTQPTWSLFGSRSSTKPGEDLPPAPQLPYTPPMQPMYPGATSYPQPVYAQAASPYPMALPTPPQMQQSPAPAAAPYAYPAQTPGPYELSGIKIAAPAGEQTFLDPYYGTVQPVPVHEMETSPPPKQDGSSPYGIQPRKDDQQR